MQNLSALDLAHFFHPCSQMSEYEKRPPIIIKRASGAYYYDQNDNAILDGISSWWVNTLGHCHPAIAAAIAKQASTLEQGILAGFSNEPIIKLSARLASLAPKNLNKCFYGDNGSSAVEIALKLAFHATALRRGWEHTRPAHPIKNGRFLCLAGGYHGETLGALGVSDVGIYKDVFVPILNAPLIAPAPNPSLKISQSEAKKAFSQLLNQHKNEIVAFIAEPLLQCAGGMNMYGADFLEFALKECKKAGIFVIFDEIATGFGRTGKLFAYEHLAPECTPDMLCLSKGITGGFLPLSVVLLSDEIYSEFYAPYGKGRDFLHSHSYAGNTLACAAANAMLDAFEKEGVLARIEKLSAHLKEQWQSLSHLKAVQNLRTFGMVAAFELDLKSLAFWRQNSQKSQRFSIDFFWRCIEKGLFLRPLGNTIYFMPPYCISKDEITSVVGKIAQIIKEYEKA